MSHHSTGQAPTAECPWCEHPIRLNKLGEFWMHKARVIGRGGKPRADTNLCPASALTPAEAEKEATK